MVEVELKDDIKVCATSLKEKNGIMLMASQYGAAFLEDGDWKLIFSVFAD